MSEALFHRRPEVSLQLAQDLVRGTCAAAAARGIAVSVAVTDRSGDLVAAARMDAAPLGSMQLAQDKAYTAALWQMPSGDLHASTQPGGVDWGLTSTAGGRIVVYAGGLPILSSGEMAGAIGVSGGTAEQDADCAATALAELKIG